MKAEKCEEYLMPHFLGRFILQPLSVVVGRGKDSTGLYFPSDLVGASDIIRIRKDLGNNILDKSWMLQYNLHSRRH
jgi:hypothetical protein